MRKVNKKQFFAPEFIILSAMNIIAIILSAVFFQAIFCMSCTAILIMFCTMQYLLCENENLRLDYYEILNEKYDLLLSVRNQNEIIKNLEKGKKK